MDIFRIIPGGLRITVEDCEVIILNNRLSTVRCGDQTAKAVYNERLMFVEMKGDCHYIKQLGYYYVGNMDKNHVGVEEFFSYISIRLDGTYYQFKLCPSFIRVDHSHSFNSYYYILVNHGEFYRIYDKDEIPIKSDGVFSLSAEQLQQFLAVSPDRYTDIPLERRLAVKSANKFSRT